MEPIPVFVRHPESATVQWCLGFLQPAPASASTCGSDDEVSVDFRCEHLAARCFPLHAVFPHNSAVKDGFGFPSVNQRVLVALRADRRLDPLILQPATVLSYTAFGVHLLCLVETPSDGTRHLVHPLQLVLAFRDVPRRSLRDLVNSGRSIWQIGVDGTDNGLIAANASLANRGKLMCCSGGTPIQSNKGWLCTGAKGPQINADMPLDLNAEEDVGFVALPLDIIEAILEHVDMLTMARLRRVCPAWNALLTTRPALRQHVTYDFSLRPTSASLADDMFRLGNALFRCLTDDLQTLALRHWMPGMAPVPVSSANADLIILSYMLPMFVARSGLCLVLQQCVVQGEINANWRFTRARPLLDPRADDPVGIALISPLHWLSPLLVMCRRLIVRDYVMRDVFGRFIGRNLLEPRLPHTYAWLERARAVDITVPEVRLDASRDTDTNLGAVMQAVEAAVAPAVSADMGDNVKVMLEYWRSLPMGEAHRYWAVVKMILALTEPSNPAWHLPVELGDDDADENDEAHVAISRHCRRCISVH
ncbi:uncharacterized protein LOC129594820 [Paramacrobiotus metropolitanus]|uniref:uncharacterized protein LOC129594820 n=1 Tax=Paramacrobiotus metropolitanus TaxID=2943436 RepID=UPI002445C56E|nr:uncharacterized protein LOC129594820 [Paramacrobiotus metropolitanus]XP_055347617.1 uncharacterized protein LOC129594820 [Paramacrobiotus metropolitanus]XP_055347618.1 uncharacterized protein LOC129594820 [Paramacrobiotus metropolitanus]